MASFEQRGKSKLWSVKFYVIDADAHRKEKRLSGYRTKKAANEAYLEYLKDIEKMREKEREEKSKIPFREVYARFLENERTKLKESSYNDLVGATNLHIIPTFGEKIISEIKPLDILNWQNNVLSSFSYNYKSKIRTRLSSIFKFAEIYYDLPNNPMRRVAPLKNKEAKKEMLFWTYEEFSRFVEKVESPVYKLFFTALFLSGCRKGELMAVGADDIDLEKSTLSISKSITTKTNAGPWEVTTPKNNASYRTIYMPKSLLEKMIDLQKQNGGRFIFGGAAPLPTTTIDRVLRTAAEKAGVKRIRVHDFRHSSASYLVSSGATIVAISKRLGHSNIEQTLNTYSHLMPSDQDLISRAINAINEKLPY